MKIFTDFVRGVLLLLFVAALTACSNVQESSKGITSYQNNVGDKSFSFKDDGIRWHVDFEDGKISAVYKNGELIPEEDHKRYEDMIYSKISELKKNMHKFKSDIYSFKIDIEKYKEDMSKMRKDLLENLPDKIEIEIDREEFNRGMEELRELLKELKTKKFEFHFDNDEFKEDMKKLKEDLKKIDFDKINIEVRKNLEEAEKDLKKVKIKIKDVDINLSSLDKDLKKLGAEMERLDNFFKEIKRELVKDGYLKNEDEKMNLIFNEELIEVNGKVLSPEHHKKYAKLYEKHFGEKLKGDFKIKIRQ